VQRRRGINKRQIHDANVMITNERQLEIDKIRDNLNISRKQACIAVSCKPSRILLNKIMNYIDPKVVSLENCILDVIEIEKFCFTNSMYPKPAIVVSIALYSNSSLSLQYICSTLNITGTTLRKWRNKLPKRFDRIKT
jgi:hypothetical protein